jgi:hypothetical protein
MVTVPYLSAEYIERDAQALLDEYASAQRTVVAAPIPIEAIAEKHLKLGLEFDDLHRRLGVPRHGLGLFPDIVGCLFCDTGRIVIDESLDPDENPSSEGWFRSVLAHEAGGHWRLHRNLSNGFAFPPTLCRSNRRSDRVEWQANFYASCLLMPRSLVFAAWDPVVRQVIGGRLPTDCRDPSVDAINDVVWFLAQYFLVSTAAMRIRLEKLGLIPVQVRHQLL